MSYSVAIQAVKIIAAAQMHGPLSADEIAAMTDSTPKSVRLWLSAAADARLIRRTVCAKSPKRGTKPMLYGPLEVM